MSEKDEKAGRRREEFETFMLKRSQSRHPHIKAIEHVTLEGKRDYKAANLYFIHAADGTFSKCSLEIGSWKRVPGSRQIDFDAIYSDKKIVVLETEEGIRTLAEYLNAHLNGVSPHESDRWLVVRVSDASEAHEFVDLLKTATNISAEHLVKLLNIVSENELGRLALILQRYPGLLANYHAAINHANYSLCIQEFERIVAQDLSEHEYQDFLTENSWMFGSFYRKPVLRRNLVAGIIIDFGMVTADGFLEIIEIKRPGTQLLLRDPAHDSYYASADLSKTIGQVAKYIQRISSNENDIIRWGNLEIDIHKIRGVIVAGRESNSKLERLALRNINHHLHEINVITYDNLLRIGNNIVELYDIPLPDIPF